MKIRRGSVWVGVVGLFESTFNFSYTVFMWRSWLLSLAFRSRQENIPRRLDLMTFWHGLQKSTKPVPEGSIWWLFGLGSRSRQNHSQKARFDDFLALAPEGDKTNPRRLDLMTFWPGWPKSLVLDLPETSKSWFLYFT